MALLEAPGHVHTAPNMSRLSCEILLHTWQASFSCALHSLCCTMCILHSLYNRRVITFYYKPGARKEDHWKQEGSVGYQLFCALLMLWIIDKTYRAVNICSVGPAHPNAGGSCKDAAHCHISWCSFVISPACVLKPRLPLLGGSLGAWLSISSAHCYPGTWPRLVGNQGPSLISVCLVESWS